jgi:Flp pilus assembly protein TadG
MVCERAGRLGGTILTALLRSLQRFRDDERGVILILFTLLIVPLMLIVGVAIDFSQTLVVKRQLAAAVDAAALAIGAELDLDADDDVQQAADMQKAEDYIRAHYPEAIGRLKTFNVLRNNQSISISATATIDTSFIRIAGYNTLDVTVSGSVSRKLNKLEVVMVLDNTGSMGSPPSKMSGLKTAANQLVDMLFGNDEESLHVKIGLVPFANAVNVGVGQRGKNWLDEGTPTALNAENLQLIGGDGFSSLFQIFDNWRLPWNGCVRSRLGGLDLTDAQPSAANTQTLFTPYFAPDETIGRANDYILNIGEGLLKSLTFYTAAASPGASNVRGPNFGCPERAVQDLTNVKSTITSALSAMQPLGNTVIPEGIAWGWRVISPGAPFTSGAPYTDQDTVKAVILLTDGDNEVSPRPNGAYRSYFSSYGFAINGHLGAVDGSQANATLDQKTAAVCENIKANKDADPNDQDIVVYTIVFGVAVGTETENMMRNCASDPSKFFNSPTEDDLQEAFQNIALGLSKLRVSM